VGNIRPTPPILGDHLTVFAEEICVFPPPEIANLVAGQQMFPAPVVKRQLEAGQDILTENRGDNVLDFGPQKGLADLRSASSGEGPGP